MIQIKLNDQEENGFSQHEKIDKYFDYQLEKFYQIGNILTVSAKEPRT